MFLKQYFYVHVLFMRVERRSDVLTKFTVLYNTVLEMVKLIN